MQTQVQVKHVSVFTLHCIFRVEWQYETQKGILAYGNVGFALRIAAICLCICKLLRKERRTRNLPVAIISTVCMAFGIIFNPLACAFSGVIFVCVVSILHMFSLIDSITFSATNIALILYECTIWMQRCFPNRFIQRLAKWNGELPLWHRTVLYGL